METWFEIIPKDNVFWLVVTVIVFLVWGNFKILSKEAVENLWLIGALYRFISDRKKRAAVKENELDQLHNEAVSNRLQLLERIIENNKQAHEEAIADLRSDFEEEKSRWAQRENELQHTIEDSFAYIQWVTDWCRKAILSAKQHGWGDELAEWKGFYEFTAGRSKHE